MKDLRYICIQPDDNYYTWQVHSWIESLRKIGQSDKAIILIFIPNYRNRNQKWDKIISLYPEAEFVFYKDTTGEVSQHLGIYIPILRPYCAMRYFEERPEMKEKAIFYCDSDTVFLPSFNIDKFIDDDINYLSNTNSYINATYFDSKIKDVLPEKLDEYKRLDILQDLTSLIGISREICEKNNENSGGAQYLLKNIDGEYWKKVYKDCLIIRKYLLDINRRFFKDENAGFQSWCSDMFSVLWNLWYREAETKIVPELDFSWASDPIEKIQTTSIYHNAGITGDLSNGYPAFYKGKYHLGANPFKDVEHLDIVLNNEESKKHCTHFYLSQLMELYNKYKIEY
jgi:hypothetical protein